MLKKAGFIALMFVVGMFVMGAQAQAGHTHYNVPSHTHYGYADQYHTHSAYEGSESYAKRGHPHDTYDITDMYRLERKIAALEAKMVLKNEVVAELLEEHVQLKKELGDL